MGKVYVSLNHVELHIPQECENMTDEELKGWIWKHEGDKLFRAMEIKYEDVQSELELCKRRLRVLDHVAEVQRRYLINDDPKSVYSYLLTCILDLNESNYGFISEFKQDDDGSTYMQCQAFSSPAWDDGSLMLYNQMLSKGLKFHKLENLFGAVVAAKKPVISNTPQNDYRSGGLPPGHPPLVHFLGIPFFDKDGELLGMVGLANKPGGYSEKDVKFLEPFTLTCSNLIHDHQHIQRSAKFINVLEEKVEERTANLQIAKDNLEETNMKLEEANHRLEAANQQVLQASAAQLQNFALMSHEIRTPLNCIIGLTSLLLETKMTPMQEESMKMIVQSGDLLLTVVNDILDYAKLETGNVDVQMRKTNLQEILNSIIHSISMKGQSKRLQIKPYYDGAVPEYIKTDGRRLQQILFNLLGNAVKFSNEDTFIELSVMLTSGVLKDARSELTHKHNRNSSRSKPVITFSTNSEVAVQSTLNLNEKAQHMQDDGDSSTTESLSSEISESATDAPVQQEIVRFVVKNFGQGIEEKDFGKIFQPFLQARAETEGVHGGTGLGLAVTAKLVSALGGKISVASEHGRWTSFTVDIPFHGDHVDVSKISAFMNDTTIYLVDRVGTLTNNFSSTIAKSYSLNVVNCDSVETFEKNLLGHAGGRSRQFVCLLNEDLYEAETFARLKRSLSNFTLVTFGPKYAASDCDLHIRSLFHALPVAVIESLKKCVQGKATVCGRPGLRPQRSSINLVPCLEMRILVAEDNLINQKVMIRMLKRLGIENVDVVDNGLKAVEHELAKEYDVVLMDMQMPVMDGIEACRQIMSREAGHAKPAIVFVTAHASSEFESECRQAGAVDYLTKPFNISAIEGCLKKIESGELRPE